MSTSYSSTSTHCTSGPNRALPPQVDRQVHPQPGLLRHRIDQVPERRPPHQRVIAPLAQIRPRNGRPRYPPSIDRASSGACSPTALTNTSHSSCIDSSPPTSSTTPATLHPPPQHRRPAQPPPRPRAPDPPAASASARGCPRSPCSATAAHPATRKRRLHRPHRRLVQHLQVVHPVLRRLRPDPPPASPPPPRRAPRSACPAAHAAPPAPRSTRTGAASPPRRTAPSGSPSDSRSPHAPPRSCAS